ncbi:universal stress protein [Fodinicola acaciae]|uniref:universal stress protein n=1 Tax=Fodinicola acaciae TaxID=2681555 RepID=UPI0013D7203A|nr:universal stress protein [Fodinicola acaciae]
MNIANRRPDRPIIVGVDGSDGANEAIAWGTAEAVRRDLDLELVLGAPPPPRVALPDGRLMRWDKAAMDRAHRRILDDAAARARSVRPNVRLSARVVHRAGAAALLSAAESASMVVIGSRGMGQVTGLLFGSTGATLVGRAGCPVVIAHPSKQDESDKLPVVLGVDDRPADELVGFALEEAAAREVPMVVLHAWNDILVDPAPGFYPPPLLEWSAIEEHGRLLAERLIGPWRAKFPDVPVDVKIVRDRPGVALVHVSASAQLVVVGSRGGGGLAGLLLGSVSRQVAHYAQCPVAVVRTVHEQDEQ